MLMHLSEGGTIHNIFQRKITSD